MIKEKKLVIVESPTKAKTITKFLGSGFEVRASVGHVRDLPKSNRQAIDIPGGFVPRYEVVEGKELVLAELTKLAKKASVVYLATDPDREGEAIAWHITQAIGLGNTKSEILQPKADPRLRSASDGQAPLAENPKPQIQRIVFHEITEHAIHEALAHPRDIDRNLVKAQEARRVLDRLVGYDLSGLIWKKVRYGLSAGRVQSPALRILMEREREVRAFIPETFWVLTGIFKTPKGTSLELICAEEPRDRARADAIIAAANGHPWQVTLVKETEARRQPKPPFTTSTLQQAASSRLGFAPSRTMGVAQKLYEQGLITYMRTDSVTVSREALPVIFAAIERFFGKELVAPRTYQTKSKSAQEAHEAVRPTDAGRRHAGANEEQRRLYNLIWSRTVASQMADARILRTKIGANVIGAPEPIPDFTANGSRVIEPGWLLADPDARGDDVELPKVAEGAMLKLIDLREEEKQTEPPDRYTEAGLVKELEKREIGRPSTYASILKTILDRGYVEKDGKTLRPTDTGDVVSTFLETHFGTYISDSFTAEMERDLDEIAEGKRDYRKTLEDFYTPFAADVKSKESLDKLTTLGEADAAHICPLCGSPMVVKLSRTGRFLSCKRFPDCAGARKADGGIIEPPKELGEACPECAAAGRKGGMLVEREGRFGRFVSCSNWKRGKNGCHYVRQSKEEEEKAKTGVKCPLCRDGDLVERRGRFGPFFSCSNYPTCKFIMKSRPTGKTCEVCGSLMMVGTKTIPDRCSNRTCVNHNPHKQAGGKETKDKRKRRRS
ncbi:MAG: type I DNA topoisomerase [bacterium]|nr:type I DNA topoisomerase [bacterium]